MTESNTPYMERIVDEDQLDDYLTNHIGEADEYGISYHEEGHSNETIFVTWDDRQLVIRRPPPGEVADTAHDVLREYSVMESLQPTEVPVPPTILSCDDHSVLGNSFYIMERVEGNVIREDEPERFAVPKHRKQIGYELIDTLVNIHSVDYDDVGLEAGEFGYPNGFTKRQVDRWSKQIEWAREITATKREVRKLDEVMAWLQNNIPSNPPTTLVHGDYKLDNVLFGPGTPPIIKAVFDWELSTLGDPFTDLGWMLSFWYDEGDPAPPEVGLYHTFTEREGYPTRQELVDRYESAMELTFENETFYRTLGVFKLAGLGEMFFRRYLEGNSNDPLYPLMETGVPQLADRAMRIINGDEPL